MVPGHAVRPGWVCDLVQAVRRLRNILLHTAHQYRAAASTEERVTGDNELARAESTIGHEDTSAIQETVILLGR
jgi:hypothetical protein